MSARVDPPIAGVVAVWESCAVDDQQGLDHGESAGGTDILLLSNDEFIMHKPQNFGTVWCLGFQC
jgi:hypothetical protein